MIFAWNIPFPQSHLTYMDTHAMYTHTHTHTHSSDSNGSSDCTNEIATIYSAVACVLYFLSALLLCCFPRPTPLFCKKKKDDDGNSDNDRDVEADKPQVQVEEAKYGDLEPELY